MAGFRSNQPGDDVAVAAALCRGEAEAARVLVERNWAPSYRLAFLVTQDHGAAEEVTQDALFAAIRAAADYDPDRPFRPWLNRIVANRANDWLRARMRRPVALVESRELETLEADETADALAEAAMPEELGAALARLNEQERAAVVFRHLLDLTPKEIAELMDVPAPTIRTWIHRGLTRLRLDLTNHEGTHRHDQIG